MKYSVLLFDLDGTLLDTLTDLHLAVNHALRAFSYPERTYDEVRLFVGNGIKKLIERAVPAGTSEEDTARVLDAFRAFYAEHSRDNTAPYPGVDDALRRLADDGYRMAIISNKVDFAVKELSREFFSAHISVAIGDREGKNKKPAPDSLFEAMAELGVTKEDCLYIGDYDVDVETAKNAGIPCIGCAWGFRGRAFLREHGLDDTWILEQPSDLVGFLKEINE